MKDDSFPLSGFSYLRNITNIKQTCFHILREGGGSGERERELESPIIYIVHNQTKIQNDLLSKVDERKKVKQVQEKNNPAKYMKCRLSWLLKGRGYFKSKGLYTVVI